MFKIKDFTLASKNLCGGGARVPPGHGRRV